MGFSEVGEKLGPVVVELVFDPVGDRVVDVFRGNALLTDRVLMLVEFLDEQNPEIGRAHV